MLHCVACHDKLLPDAAIATFRQASPLRRHMRAMTRCHALRNDVQRQPLHVAIDASDATRHAG
jgi:hypothetical protein